MEPIIFVLFSIEQVLRSVKHAFELPGDNLIVSKQYS